MPTVISGSGTYTYDAGDLADDLVQFAVAGTVTNVKCWGAGANGEDNGGSGGGGGAYAQTNGPISVIANEEWQVECPSGGVDSSTIVSRGLENVCVGRNASGSQGGYWDSVGDITLAGGNGGACLGDGGGGGGGSAGASGAGGIGGDSEEEGTSPGAAGAAGADGGAAGGIGGTGGGSVNGVAGAAPGAGGGGGAVGGNGGAGASGRVTLTFTAEGTEDDGGEYSNDRLELARLSTERLSMERLDYPKLGTTLLQG